MFLGLRSNENDEIILFEVFRTDLKFNGGNIVAFCNIFFEIYTICFECV